MRVARFITAGVVATLALAVGPGWAVGAPATFVDDDFAGGAPGAGTTVVAPGTLQLIRSVQIDEGFDAPGLPPGWDKTASGTAAASGGALRVDGTLVGPAETFDAPQSLRFTATFSSDLAQHVGLATNLAGTPGAMFSTGDGALPTGLYARISGQGDSAIDVPLAGVDPLVPHDYEIRWTAAEARFFVDGVLASTQAVTVPGGLRVLASDADVGGRVLSLDRVELGSYPAAGTFVSRVVDGGPAIRAWSTLAPAPAGPDSTFTTRTGNTLSPDESWSAPQALGAGGAIASPPGRFLQYAATLASDGTATPSVESVSIAYDVDTGGSSPGGEPAPGPAPDPAPAPDAGPAPASAAEAPAAGPARPPDRTAPSVALSSRSVRVARNGAVAFGVRCPATETLCRVTLQLKLGRTNIARTTATVRGGRRAAVTLRLPATIRAYVLSGRLRMTFTLVTVARDAAGNSATKRVKVTLRG